MTSLIEQINKDRLWDFHGGIHPPENKHQTSLSAILPVELPNELVIPLKQHTGTAGRIIVKIGEKVKKGQALTLTESHHSCPVHAPTSGKIVAIEARTICHPSGFSEQCIILHPDFADSWGVKNKLTDFQHVSPERLIEHIRQMGIAGLGGAGFPTARKIQSGLGRTQILVINGAECEPYITADDRLMQEYAEEIIQGITVLQHILRPQKIIIAIEDNKPDAITALKQEADKHTHILLKIIPTKYPSGGEKQLIQILTGQEIPKDQIPADIGFLMHNVATVFAIKRAIFDGEPLIQRVVTLAGNTLKKQANRWVLLGTPLSFLLKKHGHEEDKKLNRLIVGGPMMGFTSSHAEVPVSKTTNCLLLPSATEISAKKIEMPCIRCSACAEVCPASLLPQQLYWYAKQKEFDQCQKYHLFDCIECGACAFVCPSEIPLVQYYRQTKANIRHHIAEQQASEIAKQRFEAKKIRLEREKAERESRHKHAAIQRQQTMTNTANQDAVAAAIARVKAKQAAVDTCDDMPLAEKQKLREARKQQARAHKQAQSSTESNQSKKAAVADAVARVKAKKAKAIKEQNTDEKQPNPSLDSAEQKKAAVAAVVARAKARKAQAQNETTPTTKDQNEDN